MNERKPERPVVEPLSDITWQRVERDLFAVLDCDGTVAPAGRAATSQRAWAPWAIAGTFAAAAILVVVVMTRGTSPATPPAVQVGSATPSRIVTGDAATEISFGEAAITVDAESALTLHGDADRGVLIGARITKISPGDRARLHNYLEVMGQEA